MGRINATVRIKNVLEPDSSITYDALVDTEAANMVLPAAWKERLGRLTAIRTVACETATQERIQTEICGPVKIRIEGFEPVFSEVLFIDMQPNEGQYQPLIGYIVLEQSQAAVDMPGHRLLRLKSVDLR